MGSRALLINCRNSLLKQIQQCKYISTTVLVQKNKNLEDVSKALQVTEPIQKEPTQFFKSRDQIAHEKALEGTITIEGEVNAVGLVSGVPEEHIKTRRVRIYQPPKNAMQSGTHNIHLWQIEFDTRERWENPLMGWCSSGDPMQALRVGFASQQEAIEHCKKMGWDYFVQKTNPDNAKSRSYGANFSWDKRTRVSTK